MSQESLRRFYEAVSNDESLRAKLMAIAARYPEQDLSESQQEKIWETEMMPLAKSAGFDVTLEDLKAFQPSQTPEPGKLADEELEAVVGGRRCFCFLAGFGRGGGVGGADDWPCACALTGVGLQQNSGFRCECYTYGFGD